MSATITAGVNNTNIPIEAWQLTMNLASAITEADVGKAVSLDTSAPDTVKLATANEAIFGRLETFAHRTTEGFKTGTVSIQGVLLFPCVTSTPALGANVVGGATAGLVQTAGAPADLTAASVVRRAVVIRRYDTLKTVTVLLGT